MEFFKANALPIGTILFNFLFLLVAIALEAYVFNARLDFDKKTSVAYATSINLFANISGWLIFFLIDPLLTLPVRTELVSYVFFNNVNTVDTRTHSTVIIIGSIIFFFAFIFKIVGLQFLDIALEDQAKGKKGVVIFRQRRGAKGQTQNRNIAAGVLLANSLSYSAILGLMVFRVVAQ